MTTCPIAARLRLDWYEVCEIVTPGDNDQARKLRQMRNSRSAIERRERLREHMTSCPACEERRREAREWIGVENEVL